MEMAKGESIIYSFFDRIVLGYPKIVIGCMIAIVLFFSYEAKNFRLDASSDTLVLQNDKSLQYTRLVSSRYGQHDFLILTYSPLGDLFSDDTLGDLAKLRDKLLSVKNVSSVDTILDVPLLRSPPLTLKELTEKMPNLCSPRTNRKLAKEEFRESPIYQNLLVSPDLKTTALLINFAEDDIYPRLVERRDSLLNKKMSGPLTRTEQGQLSGTIKELGQLKDRIKKQRHQDLVSIRNIMHKHQGNCEMFLGGVSMITDDMVTYIKKDLLYFGIGVLVFLIIMLGILYRRKRWIFLPMLCCLVSVIIMVGLLGTLGWKVTVVSSNFISLQLIITLALTIHLIVRYREFREQNSEAANRELISETIRLKLKPCFYTIITTIAGFGSLVLCDMLPVIMFGKMMILGLAISFIVTFLIFPSVLVLMPKDTPISKRKIRISITALLAKFTELHLGLILTLSTFVLIAGIVGMTKLRVENSFIDYFKKSSEIYKGLKVIDQKLGGTTPLDVLIDFPEANTENNSAEPAGEASDDGFDEFDEFDMAANENKYWFTYDKTRRIKSVHEYLDSIPETGKVLSLASLLSVVEKLNDDQPLDSLELALLYNETPEKFKDMLIKPYVSVENNQVRFWVRIKDSQKSLRRNELLKKIETDLTGKLGFKKENVHLAGMMVLYNNMLQRLFRSQAVTFGLTVVILMAMFLVLFRSLKLSVIAIICNVLPVLFMLGLMGWVGLPLDMMTITIAAISLGIAVDDTIHYIHRFKHEFKKDSKYIATMYRCHGSIGHAMYDTSVTIIIGFSILTLSNFIPTVYFGLLTVLVMFIAIVSALTLLPVMLILLKPFGKESC